MGPDGMLSEYGKKRVGETLRLAKQLSKLYANVRIIWTGGASRVQVSAGLLPEKSEGQAMLDYSLSLEGSSDIPQEAETLSISTVENMTASSSRISEGLIVIATDPLHYRFGRVRFISWLVFPRRDVVRVSLSPQPHETWKGRLSQFLSMAVTATAMIGVKRGDAAAIQTRQLWLERVFRVR